MGKYAILQELQENLFEQNRNSSIANCCDFLAYPDRDTMLVAIQRTSTGKHSVKVDHCHKNFGICPVCGQKHYAEWSNKLQALSEEIKAEGYIMQFVTLTTPDVYSLPSIDKINMDNEVFRRVFTGRPYRRLQEKLGLKGYIQKREVTVNVKTKEYLAFCEGRGLTHMNLPRVRQAELVRPFFSRFTRYHWHRHLVFILDKPLNPQQQHYLQSRWTNAVMDVYSAYLDDPETAYNHIFESGVHVRRGKLNNMNYLVKELTSTKQTHSGMTYTVNQLLNNQTPLFICILNELISSTRRLEEFSVRSVPKAIRDKAKERQEQPEHNEIIGFIPIRVWQRIKHNRRVAELFANSDSYQTLFNYFLIGNGHGFIRRWDELPQPPLTEDELVA